MPTGPRCYADERGSGGRGARLEGEMSLDVGDIDLGGQVALVTGGGRGIGRATALALSNAGAAVAVTSRSEDQLRDTARLVEGAGGRVLARAADVTDRAAVEALVARAEQTLGPLTLLVNNAGLIGDYGPTWEADPEQWSRVIEVNVVGPFLCARAVLPGMVARRRGRIVNLSSGAGMGRFPHGSAYAVSKAAVTRFSENLAGEVEEYGVRVFAVSPGTVRTAMTQHVLDSPLGQKWQPSLGRVFAEGRDVPPERAAELIVYLASGRADVLTGLYLGVDYDLPAMARRAAEIRSRDLYTMRLRLSPEDA
jgi:NAD(P)-dependent dehydrogenase (short-subunit alcohol dehydrogenase family)